MIKPPRLVLVPIAFLCLVVIGYILIKENILNKNTENNLILGASTDSIPNSMFSLFNSAVDTSLQNTKENLSGKAKDVEKSVMATVESEARNLAESQVKALKLQICTNWGVIPATPSASP